MFTPRQVAFAFAGWGVIFGFFFGGVGGAFIASGAVYTAVRMRMRDLDD